MAGCAIITGLLRGVIQYMHKAKVRVSLQLG